MAPSRTCTRRDQEVRIFSSAPPAPTQGLTHSLPCRSCARLSLSLSSLSLSSFPSLHASKEKITNAYYGCVWPSTARETHKSRKSSRLYSPARDAGREDHDFFFCLFVCLSCSSRGMMIQFVFEPGYESLSILDPTKAQCVMETDCHPAQAAELENWKIQRGGSSRDTKN